MTKEHIGLLMALKIPFFVVMTKVDLAKDLKVKVRDLKKILSLINNKTKPVEINFAMNMEIIAQHLRGGALCPIFMVSCLSPNGFPEIKKFLFSLEQYDSHLDKS